MRRIFHAPISITLALARHLAQAAHPIAPRTCTRCGTSWETRSDAYPYVCPDCLRIEAEKKDGV